MQRGTITILIILGVAVAAATASVVYHYSNQKHAQGFWGTATARLIGNPSPVEVLQLSKADAGLSLSTDSDDPPAEGDAERSSEAKSAEAKSEAAPPTVKALEFNGTPWLVTSTKDAVAAKGINNLRRALVLDTTYNWSEPIPAGEPQWKYGLAMTDQRDWVTVLFDFDTRQIALAGGRKTAVLNPEASAEFQQFFAGQFAGENAAAEKTAAEKPAEAPASSEAPAEAPEAAAPEAATPEPAATP